MLTPVRFASMLVCCLCMIAPLAAGDKTPARETIAKRAKVATVLVEVKPSYGSGFCIHPSGLFVTNDHVVGHRIEGINLVLNAGLKTQKVVKAKVVRRDKNLDLALLKVEGTEPFEALAFGTDKDVGDLTELVACGFPFGLALARPGEYPAISINVGRVASLRRGTDGALHRIQLDAVINPGNSGGPVLGLHGKVIGMVVSGIPGARVNMAIPVGQLQRFLAPPEIVLTLPDVKVGNRHEAFEFTAKATVLLPSKDALDLELILGTGPGKERRFPMKLVDGAYRARAVPFPARKGPSVYRVEVKYESDSVTGTTTDQTFRVGAAEVKLSQLRNLRLGQKPEARLNDGQRREGKIADLQTLPVKVGTQSLRLDLADAVEVNVELLEEVTELSCTVLSRQAGETVGRFSAPLAIQGLRGPAAPPEWTLDLKKMKPPDAPITGKLFGAEFKPDKVQWLNTGLSLQRGRDIIHIFLSIQPGQHVFEFSPDNQTPRRPPPVISILSTSQPGAGRFQRGYAMRLEFGAEKDGKIPGKIYLCLSDDQKSYIAGSFTLDVP